MPPALLNRRCATVAMVALPMLWTGVRAQPAQARRSTPAQTEGPFYPVSLPRDSDFDLLRNGNVDYRRGQPSWVEGVVTDLQGKPVAGAQVEIWQRDEGGHYHRPGDGGKADLAFQGHHERDFLWRRLDEQARAMVTVPFVSGADGLRAPFPIIVAT